MWSETLQQQTKEYFKTLPFAEMKQFGGRFGTCVYKDGQYIIVDKESDDVYTFESMDELIANGWAID